MGGGGCCKVWVTIYPVNYGRQDESLPTPSPLAPLRTPYILLHCHAPPPHNPQTYTRRPLLIKQEAPTVFCFCFPTHVPLSHRECCTAYIRIIHLFFFCPTYPRNRVDTTGSFVDWCIITVRESKFTQASWAGQKVDCGFELFQSNIQRRLAGCHF